MDLMTDRIEPNEPHAEQPERKPWPMKYILLSIGFFILLFNLYLLFFGGDS